MNGRVSRKVLKPKFDKFDKIFLQHLHSQTFNVLVYVLICLICLHRRLTQNNFRLAMPKKPILDYSRYFAFRDGAAFCTVAGCKRPDWAYSLKNGQTTSMLKHLREKHPDKYEEVSRQFLAHSTSSKCCQFVQDFYVLMHSREFCFKYARSQQRRWYRVLLRMTLLRMTLLRMNLLRHRT